MSNETLLHLQQLSGRLRLDGFVHSANVALEGANALIKCYAGRKALADSHNALSDELLELKVKHQRLLTAHREMGEDINNFVNTARKLGMCREQA